MTPASRAGLAAFLALSTACSGTPEPRPERKPDGQASQEKISGEFAEMACGLRREHILGIWRGYDAERSGEIQIVPESPNFVGAWLSHSGPWSYLQRVPLFLYGPGHVPAAGRIRRPVTLADLAPTLGALMDFDFDAPDGKVIEKALRPGTDPPRLIVVVVWDSAGRNVLAEYPRAWPVLRRLIPEGAWFDRATVGSSPSVTPAVHTTLGTGAYPRRHGLMDLRFRVEGELRGVRNEFPTLLRVPALTDLYDRARGNVPKIGIVGPVGTLGMIGHGSLFEGGDKDLAVLYGSGVWRPDANSKYYRYPDYIDPVPEVDLEALDAADGMRDGRWRDAPIEDIKDPNTTPAFAPYQTDLLRRVIVGEGFGADEAPDALFTNYRAIDKVGHVWSMNSRQMEDVVRSSDRALGDLIAILDREVGRGRWVIALTADHGSTPKPEKTGALVINPSELQKDIEEAFGRPGGKEVVEDVRVTQMWLDEKELAEGGFTLEDVARFIADYTAGQNARGPSQVPAERRNERVFAAAFPSKVLEDLPCLPG